MFCIAAIGKLGYILKQRTCEAETGLLGYSRSIKNTIVDVWGCVNMLIRLFAVYTHVLKPNSDKSDPAGL